MAELELPSFQPSTDDGNDHDYSNSHDAQDMHNTNHHTYGYPRARDHTDPAFQQQHVHDADTVVARIVRAAKGLLSCPGPSPSHLRTSPTFVLCHPRALDLVHNALRLNGVESIHKLRIEYHGDRGRLRMSMTDSPLHSRLAILFSDLVHAASRTKLGHLDNVLSHVPTQGETGRLGRLSPDWGWTALPHDPMPRLVFEVAYSQDLESVADKCEEYMTAGGGIVCAVVGIKICYSKSEPAALATILEHLDDCYVGL
ncbi:hypothetical protein CH063_02944 [Colletotrichum higginsianum]|uniref:Uncharacterized protein n=2 Tax=Colletotrichum higginsianum TaxID=80884 RepID=H1VRN1_COLHI|nr:hypothetical protein CH63R_09632 [Colletotrichum higginsianum IMI 349063]OBR08111.1 hypothetical protein CH63R_09632 [Colletotrichum higginsianum IMI 349063]CCF42887.1 hypothetical protein CH063_02944 [Colletotrichum higginsianum]